MRINAKTLENMIYGINSRRGFDGPSWNTVGAYRLYKDYNGYAVHEICNEAGGVNVLGNEHCMTATECYYFLSGIQEGLYARS